MEVRSLFISDLHLGSRGCQAKQILDFLRHHDSRVIYLVGDIIDGWQLSRRWYWPESHGMVLSWLVAKAAKGAEVIYVSGNHDDFVTQSTLFEGLGFRVCRRHVHVGADGARYLVLHGDQFDLVERHARWLSRLAARVYQAIVFANACANRVGRRLGFRYHPYSAWLKYRLKAVVCFISEFESNLRREAEQHGHQGVICGHIHHPALRREDGFCYMNTGDWVESCSAIVESREGEFRLIRWGQQPTLEERSARGAWRLPSALARGGVAAVAAGMLGAAFCVRLLVAAFRWPFAA